MLAPQIDNLLELFSRNSRKVDASAATELLHIWNLLQRLEPQGTDEQRNIWLVAERGSIEDFADFDEFMEEGIVENRQDFEEEWLASYPESEKWYLFSVLSYKNETYFYFNNRLVFHIQPESEEFYTMSVPSEFIDWLANQTNKVIEQLTVDASKYMAFLDEKLPKNKRFGKILRSAYWEIFPECKSDFDALNNPESLRILKAISQISSENIGVLLKEITAGDFYRYCEIGYNATFYASENSLLSPKEKYLAQADGRDCGLRHIDENSAEAFENWLIKESHCGGHPWEIARGGNSTHISLYVQQISEGYYLRLAGKSRGRAPETLKMAIALYKAQVPFILQDSEALFAMCIGTDFIGIVPDFVMPRYCDSHFPDEDKIIDFMQLNFEKQREIIEKTELYKLQEIRLISKR